MKEKMGMDLDPISGGPFGGRLQWARKYLELSQEEIAEALGITRAYVSKLETNRTRPSGQLLFLLCKTYGMNLDWVMSGTGRAFEVNLPPVPIVPTHVLKAIQSERDYQEKKWPNHRHSVGEWVLIMDKCMTDAKRAYVTGHGDDSALHEIRQVVAVGVAAMEQCGALKRNA